MVQLCRYVRLRFCLRPPTDLALQASQAVSLLELLGIITSGLTGLIGLNCGFTPLPGGVAQDAVCDDAATPLCCQEPDIVRTSAFFALLSTDHLVSQANGISAGCELLNLQL